MKYREVEGGYLIRFDHGEEVISLLNDFVLKNNVPSGVITGMGALSQATIGIFNVPDNSYMTRVFKDTLDVGNLTGNIAYKEDTGEPFIHCHVTVSDSLMQTFTGHLFDGIVLLTLEIHMQVFKEKLVRENDPRTGYIQWRM